MDTVEVKYIPLILSFFLKNGQETHVDYVYIYIFSYELLIEES